MAVGALVPIIIGAGNVIRMAAPKVAQMLIKKGVGKKASQAAVKKLRSPAKRINAKDANKLASQDAGTIRRATKALGKTSPKVKKTTAAKKSTAKKTTADKKTGMSPVQKGIVVGTPVVGGLTYLATRDKKKEAQAATPKRKPSVPKTKPKIQSYKPDMPTGTKPSNQSSSDPFDVKSKKDEAMSFGEMVKGAVGLRGKEGLEGKKRLVKTPFGNVTFDTSDSAFEEPEEYKTGGKVKRNVGGKVRGVGQAVKGFGKATYSNKLI